MKKQKLPEKMTKAELLALVLELQADRAGVVKSLALVKDYAGMIEGSDWAVRRLRENVQIAGEFAK